MVLGSGGMVKGMNFFYLGGGQRAVLHDLVRIARPLKVWETLLFDMSICILLLCFLSLSVHVTLSQFKFSLTFLSLGFACQKFSRSTELPELRAYYHCALNGQYHDRCDVILTSQMA